MMFVNLIVICLGSSNFVVRCNLLLCLFFKRLLLKQSMIFLSYI